MQKAPPPQKEVVLENRQLIWVFLGISLLCGVFFGLGYIVGSHTGPSEIVNTPAVALASSSEKPSSLPPATYIPRNPTAAPPATGAEGGSGASDADLSFYQSVQQNTPQAAAGAATAAAAPAPAEKAAPAVVPPPAGILVQVSALSKREDADSLVALLKDKNLPVLVTSGQNDSLFHVVVGPYTAEADAQRVKQDLEQEGFRPFIRR